jgi:TATA-box binding protein (TBP) (component of TFIID and TFIIIB)
MTQDGGDVLEDEGVPDASIVNVVSQFCLKRETPEGTHERIDLNLEWLCFECRQRGGIPMKYNPSRFAAGTIQIQMACFGVTASVLLFGSGNAVLGGAKTEELSRMCAQHFAAEMTRVYRIPLAVRKFSIANLVCHMNTGFPMDLRHMDHVHGAKSKYKPDGQRSFPALRYHPDGEENSVYLFYPGGPIVITGANTRETLHRDHVQAYRMGLECPLDTVRALTRRTLEEQGRRVVEARMNRKPEMKAIMKEALYSAAESVGKTEFEAVGKKYMKEHGVAYKRTVIFQPSAADEVAEGDIKIPMAYMKDSDIELPRRSAVWRTNKDKNKKKDKGKEKGKGKVKDKDKDEGVKRKRKKKATKKKKKRNSRPDPVCYRVPEDSFVPFNPFESGPMEDSDDDDERRNKKKRRLNLATSSEVMSS